MIKSYVDLEIYQLSYQLSIDIFRLSKSFPSTEKYSLTSQIVRSTRSICANIAEGFGRRVYYAEFRKFLVYSIGSLEETRVWLSFARDCEYISEQEFRNFTCKTDEIGAKIFKLYSIWK